MDKKEVNKYSTPDIFNLNSNIDRCNTIKRYVIKKVKHETQFKHALT